MTTALDLSTLPPPAVVDSLDYEAALAASQAHLATLLPDWDATALEADPANKLLQLAQYLDLLLRARINTAAVANMLATARGTDLDNLVARYACARLSGESDARLRERAQIAYHQVASAGSRERYRYHALSHDLRVRQVDVWSTTPGRVEVALAIRDEALASEVTEDAAAIGTALFGRHPRASSLPQPWTYFVMAAENDLFRAVAALLLSDAIAPMGADIRPVLPVMVPYTLAATLVLPRGPAPASVLAAAQTRLAARLVELQRFRVDVHRAALHEALLVPGVRDVVLASPAADIAIGPGQLAVCTVATLTTAVHDD